MKLKNLAILFFAAGALSSCNFMDCDESDNYSLEEIQGSYNRVKQFVTDVYGYLPSDFCSIGSAMLDAATDDAIHIYESSTIQRFTNGSWSANYTVDDQYANYYNAIHDANLYLEDMTNLDFETWKNSENYEYWMTNYTNWQYEVRFLRAYYYFELVRRYQNIPLVTKTLTKDEANNAEPASAQTILDFIISECEDVAPKLPITYNDMPDKENGRITRAAALALKSRATLYAASPLYNTSNDKTKWAKAAEAAYELIGNASELGVGLDNSFANLFGATNYNSKEVILIRPTGTSKTFEQLNYPMGVTGGKTSTCPTENLASAFEMKDGRAFDWNDATMKANPYANRDPRFYLTIVHNGMAWPAKTAVDISEGGANGLPKTNATTTGYYLRKYVNNSISFEAGSTTAATQHSWVLFRYAEILLNYAEAMINAYDDCNYTNSTCKMSALTAVNAVRGRNGIKMPAISGSLNATDFLKAVKHERRVEMAFEGQRFWDLRRWKDLNDSKDIYAVKITKENESVNYQKTLLESRAISDKLYFYPIANTERFKNSNLIQNPGWD